jgi:hypothetical protein
MANCNRLVGGADALQLRLKKAGEVTLLHGEGEFLIQLLAAWGKFCFDLNDEQLKTANKPSLLQ